MSSHYHSSQHSLSRSQGRRGDEQKAVERETMRFGTSLEQAEQHRNAVCSEGLAAPTTGGAEWNEALLMCRGDG